MHSSRFGRSTAFLVPGVVLLLAGYALWDVGRVSALVAALQPRVTEDTGLGAQVGGIALGLLGLALLVLGLHRLATNVDLAAYEAATRLAEREAHDDEHAGR